MLFERLPSMIDNGIKIMLGIFLIALFWTQRDRLEYLWLALHLITVAPLAYLDLEGSYGHIESLRMAGIVISLLLFSAFFYFEFLISFLSLRKRWYTRAMRYTGPLLLAPGPLIVLLHSAKWMPIALGIAVIFACFWLLAWVVFVGLTLTIAAFKRNYEAALLLLPLLLSVVGMVELASMTAASRRKKEKDALP